MKGVVFNLLEEVVVQEYSQDVWEDLIDKTGAGGAYTSLGNYSDEELVSLVTASAEALGKTPGEILRWFGRSAMPLLASRSRRCSNRTNPPDGRDFRTSGMNSTARFRTALRN